MRKSSLGRRSSSISCNDVSLAPQRGDKKSFLLQPGFSQKKRRAVSEDRLSGVPPPRILTSVKKSRCDMSLLETLPPCTPSYFKENANHGLLGGSCRPNRSHTSSMESHRFSSIGGLKCSKKETRPVNDKQFQQQALKKVQDFFQSQPRCTQILDNTNTVKPMTLRKFINMVDYLAKFIDERIDIVKENYVDVICRLAKNLNYGGKIDRPLLMCVNTAHTWGNVIAFLVWLVDLVLLTQCVENDDTNFLYPEPLDNPYDDNDCNTEDVILESNMRFIQPLLCEQFQMFKKNAIVEQEFDRQDNQLVNQLLLERELTDEHLQHLQIKESKYKTDFDNPEYEAEEMQIKDKNLELENLRVAVADYKEYINRSKSFIEIRTNEINTIKKSLENLIEEIKERTKERERVKKEENDLKKKLANDNEENKNRIEYDQIIHYNEKCTAEIQKSLYKLELAHAKFLNQMEAPLIEYTNMIAIYTKNEPRLKNCIVDKMHMPSFVSKEVLDEIDENLNKILEDWKKIVSEKEANSIELENKLSLLETSESEICDELQKKKEELDSQINEKNNFLRVKEKEQRKLQNDISKYEEETKKLMECMPVIDYEERDKIVVLIAAQEKELKETADLIELYSTRCDEMKAKFKQEKMEELTAGVEKLNKKIDVVLRKIK